MTSIIALCHFRCTLFLASLSISHPLDISAVGIHWTKKQRDVSVGLFSVTNAMFCLSHSLEVCFYTCFSTFIHLLRFFICTTHLQLNDSRFHCLLWYITEFLFQYANYINSILFVRGYFQEKNHNFLLNQVTF